MLQAGLVFFSYLEERSEFIVLSFFGVHSFLAKHCVFRIIRMDRKMDDE